MWKTRTKISKLLTNIHAGFVTALLGCVLTFAPLSAMGSATATISPSTCTLNGPYTSLNISMSCPNATEVTTQQSSVTSDLEYWCWYSPTYAKYYYVGVPSCATSETTQTASSGNCSFSAIIPECSTGTGTGGDDSGDGDDSGGGSISTGGAIKCSSPLDCSASGSAGTGYIYIRAGKCPNAPGTCTDITYSYSCAQGYGGTASCIRKNIGSVLSPMYIFECSGCYQSCSTDSDCPTNSTKKTNGGTYEVHRYKCISNLCKYGYVINDTDCTCKKGYYGTPVKNASYTGCTNLCQQCPPDTKSGVTGTTLGESRGKTSSYCYIPGDTPFTTTAGSGTYSGNCSY